VQVSHVQLRAGVAAEPGVAFAVDPGDLHADRQRAHTVGVGVVTDVQDLVRMHACGRGTREEDP